MQRGVEMPTLISSRLHSKCEKIGSYDKDLLEEAFLQFSLSQNSKFFHSLSITSIFSRLHRVLNVGKKIINYTV
jgi:hypothetical protein